MKPEKVNILGIEYKIIYVDNPVEVDIYKRDALWGQIDYWTRTIRIYDNGDKPLEDIWQALWHEVVHGIVDLLHIKSLEGKEKEDDVDLLALALNDILFRNEWIK